MYRSQPQTVIFVLIPLGTNVFVAIVKTFIKNFKK